MKKRIFTGLLSLAMCLSLVACSSSSDASSYPSKAVSVIVPFTAGGGTDLVSRAIVDAAKDSFPKGISVENKTGGSGLIGLTAGANAATDGTVLTTICVELVTLPHTTAGTSISASSFEPIINLNSTYSVITVKADSPYNSLEELLEAAKTEEIQMGNSGIGAIWHLAAAALCQETGVEFTHIPFEGATPAITSLLGGHIDAVSVSYPEVSAQVEAGELKVLATLSPERNEAIADVPTAIELGYEVAVGTWRGLAVPAGTDQEIVDTLSEIFAEAAESDAFVTFMNNNNLDIDITTTTEYKEKIDSEYELFGTLIESLGLSAN